MFGPRSAKGRYSTREADEAAQVAREWVRKGDNDLKNAAFALQMEEECPTDTVCFHAQQCVEKYLKALLVLLAVDFPRTHDIRRLLMFLPPDLASALSPADQERLTDYAVATRYPGDYEPISLKEARRAVQLARAIRRAPRKVLPKEVTRRNRRSTGH